MFSPALKVVDSHAAWTSLIFNNYFFLGISIFAVFFVALQHVAEAGWSTVIKRVPEAIMTFLPYTCAVMISGQTYKFNKGKYNTGLNFILKYQI